MSERIVLTLYLQMRFKSAWRWQVIWGKMFYPERGISAAFRASALAFVVGLVGVACAAQPSLAVTLTIDGSGTPYTESGFTIVPIRIVNGNCDGASGNPCLALNSGEISQLSKVGGGAFNLDGFGFEFQGQPSVLTVTAYSGATLITTLVYGDPTYPDKNVWYTMLRHCQHHIHYFRRHRHRQSPDRRPHH